MVSRGGGPSAAGTGRGGGAVGGLRSAPPRGPAQTFLSRAPPPARAPPAGALSPPSARGALRSPPPRGRACPDVPVLERAWLPPPPAATWRETGGGGTPQGAGSRPPLARPSRSSASPAPRCSVSAPPRVPAGLPALTFQAVAERHPALNAPDDPLRRRQRRRPWMLGCFRRRGGARQALSTPSSPPGQPSLLLPSPHSTPPFPDRSPPRHRHRLPGPPLAAGTPAPPSHVKKAWQPHVPTNSTFPARGPDSYAPVGPGTVQDLELQRKARLIPDLEELTVKWGVDIRTTMYVPDPCKITWNLIKKMLLFLPP
uniref:Nascent polypeptide-associated complex subunit alpha, muscle-specific form-like n=1 Tax=Phascolarctos cinereus TaxID=38626 RepID=A0A6P5JVP3_PHACI|nr:nascent polypeptide-associated complex subunit alpha, muscle-specific form-like [Phascolarctos cinereus]